MQGAEYVYETNWGEQLSSVVNPLPVVLNLCTEECTVLDTSKVGNISCKDLWYKICGGIQALVLILLILLVVFNNL